MEIYTAEQKFVDKAVKDGKPFNNDNRKPAMYFHSSLMVPIALFLLSGLIGSAAEAAVTAPHEIPVLSGMTP